MSEMTLCSVVPPDGIFCELLHGLDRRASVRGTLPSIKVAGSIGCVHQNCTEDQSAVHLRSIAAAECNEIAQAWLMLLCAEVEECAGEPDDRRALGVVLDAVRVRETAAT